MVTLLHLISQFSTFEVTDVESCTKHFLHLTYTEDDWNIVGFYLVSEAYSESCAQREVTTFTIIK